MKTVILAGGTGSRLGQQTHETPKALLTVGDTPLLSHIMRLFMHHGHFEFIVATGHLANSITEYFSKPNDLFTLPKIETADGALCVTDPGGSGLVTQIINTGLHTGSGGRLRRLRDDIGANPFFLAWCDGLADLDLTGLLDFHREHGKIATVTAVRSPPRFGRLTLDGDCVVAFDEKPGSAQELINGGFFVLEAAVMDFIESDMEMIETGALPRLAAAGELMAFRHQGFWDCVDTPADLERMEDLWRRGAAPWHTGDASS